MRLRTWLLPAFNVLSVIAILVWTWLAFDTVGGFTRATPGVRVFVYGFDGIAALIVLSADVVAALFDASTEAVMRQVEARHLPLPVLQDVAAIVEEHTRQVEEAQSELAHRLDQAETPQED